MTTVARCLTIDQALFLRSVLDGCGVKAFVPDELTAQTDPVIFMGSMNSRMTGPIASWRTGTS